MAVATPVQLLRQSPLLSAAGSESLCVLSVLCVSVVNLYLQLAHRRGTENTENAQRKLKSDHYLTAVYSSLFTVYSSLLKLPPQTNYVEVKDEIQNTSVRAGSGAFCFPNDSCFRSRRRDVDLQQRPQSRHQTKIWFRCN